MIPLSHLTRGFLVLIPRDNLLQELFIPLGSNVVRIV